MKKFWLVKLCESWRKDGESRWIWKKKWETMIGMQKAIDNRGRYQRLIEMITRLGGPLSSPSAHLRLLYEHAN